MSIRIPLAKTKQLFMLVCMLGCLTTLAAQNAWTPVLPEESEYRRLMQNCDAITENFAYRNSLRSSSYFCAIFWYLKNIGTPVSLRALKAQIAMGCIPASYLNNI